jgi:hypothetical protein
MKPGFVGGGAGVSHFLRLVERLHDTASVDAR